MKFKINLIEAKPDQYYICTKRSGKHKVIEGPYKDITSSGFLSDYADIRDEISGVYIIKGTADMEGNGYNSYATGEKIKAPKDVNEATFNTSAKSATSQSG